MRTIQIATEDRFVAVKFHDAFEIINVYKTLRDLLKFGFAEGYTLLCDCRHIPTIGSEIADGILNVCGAGIPTICLESSRERLREFARRRKLLEVPLLSVRHGQSPLNYVTVDATLFDDYESLSFNDPRFNKAFDKFRDAKCNDERILAGQFVDGHYDVEKDAEGWYHFDRSENEEYAADRGRSLEALDESDLEHYRGLVDDLYTRNALASLRALRYVLRNHASNSLLVEYAVQVRGSAMLLTPYHSRAIHSIETKDEILLGRPAVIASKTATLLAPQIHEFEMLLGKSRAREQEIQAYLERNPAILRALGYAHVYPQVVLQRDDGTFLRPDFIVQPTSDEWCDIIDIKLPRMRTVVGIRDRKTLASAIHELAAQLREYAAYFENEKLSRRLEQLYGIKCYRPRLIGVVGTDPRLADDRQMRRLMTAYSDIKVLTFDQLLKHAKTRLLI